MFPWFSLVEATKVLAELFTQLRAEALQLHAAAQVFLVETYGGPPKIYRKPAEVDSVDLNILQTSLFYQIINDLSGEPTVV